MSTPEKRNITVSQETLRLELDNLRLGLEATLATKDDVVGLVTRLDSLDRGELPVGLQLQISALIEAYLRDKLTGSWQLRASKTTTLQPILTILAVSLSAFAIFHG